MGISGLFEKVDRHRPGACGGVPSRCKTPLLTQTGWRMVKSQAIRSRNGFDKNGAFCKTRIWEPSILEGLTSVHVHTPRGGFLKMEAQK